MPKREAAWVGNSRAPDMRTRDELHAKCAADVDAFLKAGGKIQQIDAAATAYDGNLPTKPMDGRPIRGRDKLRKALSRDRDVSDLRKRHRKKR